MLASLVACFACGAVSLARGQDAAWDVLNYHVYVPWSWFDHRLQTDLAPAQLQSYFNPLLDSIWYALVQANVPRIAAWSTGAVQGLVFAFVALIVGEVVRDLPVEPLEIERGSRRHWPWMFGAAALASAPIYHELGSAMGDATSAVPVLAALWAVLRALRAPAGRDVRWIAVAGLTLGVAEALKLTNAPAAVALAGAVMLAPGRPLARRAVLLATLTMGAVLSFAGAAGPWLLSVADVFGNPLFPLATRWFPSPLATPITFGGSDWGAHGLIDLVTWPMRLTLEPLLGGEVPMRQFVWPMVEVALVAAAIARVSRRRAASAVAGSGSSGAAVVIVAFVTIGFATWALLLGGHRYLAAEEALVPLAIVLLVPASTIPRPWRTLAAAALGAALLTPLIDSVEFGHEDFGAAAYRVERPPVIDPAKVSALLVGGAPQAWRVPFLWPQAAYIGLGGNFPEGPGYLARVDDIVASRPDLYAMLPANVDRAGLRFAEHEVIAARWHLDRGTGCTAMRWLAQRGWDADVVDITGGCRLVRRQEDVADVAAMDRRARAEARTVLEQRGFVLDESACRRFDSFVGAAPYPFQWCPVRRSPEAATTIR